MQYLLQNSNSDLISNCIQEINKIIFNENTDVIVNEVFIISKEDADENFPNRISMAINKSFAITQSFLKEEKKIHLIVINEELCVKNKVNLPAIILHEIGHIVNEYGKKIKLLEAIEKKVNFQEENTRIQLENEFHADYYAKHYGHVESIIENLHISLNQGYDDEELNRRIEELKGNSIRLTNRVRSYTI